MEGIVVRNVAIVACSKVRSQYSPKMTGYNSDS
jgi:hypothetical protein